jgi:hypothetical protein
MALPLEMRASRGIRDIGQFESDQSRQFIDVEPIPNYHDYNLIEKEMGGNRWVERL